MRVTTDRWRLAAFVLAAVLCILQIRWQSLNHAPPSWDESGYLLQAASMFDAWRARGWHGFHHAFYYNDPGKVGFTSVLAQPAFALFGVSLRSAMVPYALGWFVAAWALFTLGAGAARQWFGCDARRAGAAGFLAFLLWAVNPLSDVLAQSFLVEFPLAVLLAVTAACALIYEDTGRKRWLLLEGIAAGCGMLTKVTFPMFLAPVLLLHAAGLRRRHYATRAWASLLLVLVAAWIICGRFYVRNFHAIYAQTMFLSSSQLAEAFGQPARFDLPTILKFWGIFLVDYELALCSVATLLFIAVARRSGRTPWFGLTFTLSWVLVPFTVVLLSAFKHERYFYPGEMGLALLAGVALSALVATWPRRVMLAALFVVPAIKLAMVNSVPVPARLTSHLTYVAPAPDPRDHKTDALVRAINDSLPPGGGTIVMLSASTRYCHANLLRFAARQAGIPLHLSVLPAFSNPGMAAPEALAFVRTQPHVAVLHKIGTAVPPEMVALDATVAAALSSDPNYLGVVLPFQEPDGCAYEMFVRTSGIERVDDAARDAMLTRGAALARDVPFGDQFTLTLVFEPDAKVLDLIWTAVRPATLDRVVLVHLIDGAGKILRTFDHPQSPDTAAVPAGTRWVEAVGVDAAALRDARTVGIGVYDPAGGPATALPVGAGNSDWEGRRALIPLR